MKNEEKERLKAKKVERERGGGSECVCNTNETADKCQEWKQ